MEMKLIYWNVHQTTIPHTHIVRIVTIMMLLSLVKVNIYNARLQCFYIHYFIGNCTNGAVRLRGSSDPTIGRVEFCANGIWGTICSDYWDYEDASVFCNQLGFSPYG